MGVKFVSIIYYTYFLNAFVYIFLCICKARRLFGFQNKLLHTECVYYIRNVFITYGMCLLHTECVYYIRNVFITYGMCFDILKCSLHIFALLKRIYDLPYLNTILFDQFKCVIFYLFIYVVGLRCDNSLEYSVEGL